MAHLNEIFKTGKLIEVVYPEMATEEPVMVWVARPNQPQQDMVAKKARSARARRFIELKADNEEGIALKLEVDEMKKPEIVEALLDGERGKYRKQAYNEVMFSEDFGSDWGKEGEKFIEALNAAIERSSEIIAWNEEHEAAGNETEMIEPLKDKELMRINEIQEQFSAEVTERTEELLAGEHAEVAKKTLVTLRAELLKARVSLECDMEWMKIRRYGLLHYALRYPDEDDRSKLYFQSQDDIISLPPVIQEQLFAAQESLEMGVEDIKN